MSEPGRDFGCRHNSGLEDGSYCICLKFTCGVVPCTMPRCFKNNVDFLLK